MSQPWSPSLGASPEMNFATWADRVLAAIIDGLLVLAGVVVLYVIITIISMVIGGIGMGLSSATGSDEAGGLVGLLSTGICCVAFVLVPLMTLVIGLYNKVYLVSKRGCSIGQGIMKLNVVTAGGNFVPTGTLVLRLLVQMGFGLIPFLPLLSILWPLWDPQRQALHDKAVGTFVVKVA